MAWTPCLSCGQRFKGEAENVYVTHPLGDQVERYRWVVCPSCADAVLLAARKTALYRDGDGDWCLPDPDDAGTPRYEASEPREGPQTSRKLRR